MNTKGFRKITGVIFLLTIVMIINSCGFNRKTAQYPVIYPDHHKKTYGWAVKKNKAHQHSRVAKDTTRTDNGFISKYETIPRIGTRPASHLDPANTVTLPAYQNSSIKELVNAFETLTASLTNEPLILIHPLTPDTTKNNKTSPTDSTYISNAKSPPTYINRIGSTELTKEKTNSSIFAIVSFACALLLIPSLLIGGSLWIILSLAALVFGILGLNSDMKPLAIAGLLIIISAVVLFLILIVYLSTAPQ